MRLLICAIIATEAQGYPGPSDPGAFSNQMIAMISAFARGRMNAVSAAAAIGQNAIENPCGHRSALSTATMIGTRKWPTTRIVSHGAASSDRICPYGSPQFSQAATGFK
jgi:hypothetical protein